jgi:drug/metabolite transporter (DMT)-like permease
MLILGGLLCIFLHSSLLQALGLMLCFAASFVFAVAVILRSRKVLHDN